MTDKQLKSIIESVLFYWGDPIDFKSLAELLEITVTSVKKLVNEMAEEYEFSQRGIILKLYSDKVQLVTNSINHDYIEKLRTNIDEKSLSNALLETLSIIAYKQPITRIEVEEIRGVKSSSTIQTLFDRGLIKELGKLDQIGRPIIYGTTDEFLRVFGLKNIDELPEISLDEGDQYEIK